MVSLQCIQCQSPFEVVTARRKTAKFCSKNCRYEWRKTNFTGENNPNFRGGKFKKCQHCDKEFWVIPALEHQKFCSKPCADIGGFRYSGKDHANYREEARRKNRSGSHHKWVNAVMSRDKATCQKCGAKECELHAHHILSYKDHPDLRFDVNNGVVLCFKCHWEVHTAQNDKAVNSVEPLTASETEGNTEPSSQGNLIEGVTTRGRAYRRWVGLCDWCKTTISKPLSDTTGKKNLFCGKHCMGKFGAANRTYRQWKNPDHPTAVISSTSPAPERDDIV